MIAKTTIGRSFKGCCAYNMQKVEMGKGQVLMSQGVRDYELNPMVADFTRQAKMNPELTRSVWHTAISFDPKDEARLQLQPELMKAVASEYLTGMGLDQSQYVVIQHQDTVHSHFHIIANRVASNGQSISDSHNYNRSEKLLREIEQKHSLTLMKEQGYRLSLEHIPDRDRHRLEMRNEVRQSLERSTNSAELKADLAQRGIEVIVNRDQAGKARGLSFERISQIDNGEEIKVAFKGSKLHQNLSLGHIQEQLLENSLKRALELSKKPELDKSIGLEKGPQIEDKQLKQGRSLGM
ncbi:relaxase/mobilization nuclease domain-containing protein [Spirosoma endophyticum]|uniref:Relaxase/Mobilisation nuclease domain-containing protein n=1 Tax=Spirosoma endophyticum TaxID=662367 RepID=A0A1I2HV46_9BACT|nr:relaxase/mobilization nuclease domain-containing protein [Spirosoma endophyticum]SFF34035.1 Relaxase/Mobilisation nuclease domain-containing protein [Spirosoma endophyticum]